MKFLNNLSPFKLHHQDHGTDKYSSMALCTRNTVEIKHYEYLPSLNALKCDLVYSQSQDKNNFSFAVSKASLQHPTMCRLFGLHI